MIKTHSYTPWAYEGWVGRRGRKLTLKIQAQFAVLKYLNLAVDLDSWYLKFWAFLLHFV